jgi:hypothetical protein
MQIKSILKTILAVILAAMMIITVAACDAQSASSEDNRLTRAEKEEGDEEEEEKTEKEEVTEEKVTEAPRQTEAPQTLATAATTAAPQKSNIIPLKTKTSETLYIADTYFMDKYYSFFLTEDYKLMYSVRDSGKKFPNPLAPQALFENIRDFYLVNGRMYVLKTDNTLWAFGDNDYGELGPKLEVLDDDGFTVEVDYYPPENAVLVMANVANVTGNLEGIITTDKRYWQWNGDSAKGFVTETELTNVVDYYEGSSLYLQATGDVYNYNNYLLAENVKELCILDNDYFALTVDDKLIDLDNEGAVVAEDVAKVFGYDDYDTVVSIIKKDGSLWSMGENSNAELGDGSKTDRDEFVKIADSVMFAGIYCYVKTDGTLFTWNSSSPAHIEYTGIKFKSGFTRPAGYYPMLFAVDGGIRVPRDDEPDGVRIMEPTDGVVYQNLLAPVKTDFIG